LDIGLTVALERCDVKDSRSSSLGIDKTRPSVQGIQEEGLFDDVVSIALIWRSKAVSKSPESGEECVKGCHRIEVPTEDEIQALRAMRAIKEKVRDLNHRISEIGSSSGEKDGEAERLEDEINHLKREWKKWEERLKEAARIRMILLGHENPD
jgi:chromosome segregation ATPase